MRLVGWLVLAGCAREVADDSASPVDTAPPPVWDGVSCVAPPVVELGLGTAEFLPVVPLDGVEVVAGLQGGYHLEYAVRTLYLQSPVRVRTRVVHEDTGLVLSDLAFETTTAGCGTCCRFRPGLQALLDTTALGSFDATAVLPGEVVVLSADVTDGLWAASGSVRLTAREPGWDPEGGSR